MPTNLEQTILRNLLTDEKYMRKVLPFIKPDYFEGIYRILFREAGKFVAKYNKLPNAESFKIELDQSDKLSDEQYNMAMDIVPQLFTGNKVDDKLFEALVPPFRLLPIVIVFLIITLYFDIESTLGLYFQKSIKLN